MAQDELHEPYWGSRRNQKQILKKFIYLFLVLHFTLVITGSQERKIFTEGKLSMIEDVYSDMTGANSGFKFFAPNVGSDPRVVFEIYHKDGKVTERFMHTGRNREAELRWRGMISQFWDEADNEKMRRALTASWSGKIFARYPDSKEIVVKVQSYFLPTMEEWRKGRKPYWEDYYKVKYRRPVF